MAVFARLVLPAESEVRPPAPRFWRTIQQAPLEPDTRDTLSEILAFWLFERFKSLSKKEIWTMLQVLTPLEQTRAYQEIFAESRAEGLKRLLTRRFDHLPDGAMQQINQASVEQLDAWLDEVLDTESLESLLGHRAH